MSAIFEVAERLQDTQAALLELERTISQNPLEASLLLTRDSLIKRQIALEEEFASITDNEAINVCSYRLFSETKERYTITALADSLHDFQSWFTVVYDSLKNGPKQRARIAVDIADTTALHFGYTFSGSVGFALTIDNERMLFGNTDFDSAMMGMFEMARSESSDQIAHFSKQYGPAAIRQMYKWVKDHLQGVMGADIEWRRKDEIKANLLATVPHLQNLKLAIEETSDENIEIIRVTGELVGLDTDLKRFHMLFPESEEIKGDISDSVGTYHSVEIPKVYEVEVRKTTKINYATDKEDVSYHLIQIL